MGASGHRAAVSGVLLPGFVQNSICSILVQFLSNCLSICFVRAHVVHPLSSFGTMAPWKKSHFILLDKSHFDMIKYPLLADLTFARHLLMSLSVDEMLLLRYINLSTNFREQPFRVEMPPSWLKHMNSFCLLLHVQGYGVGIWPW